MASVVVTKFILLIVSNIEGSTTTPTGIRTSISTVSSTLSKVAKGFVIYKELIPVLLSAIDPAQFGFIPGSCTTSALIFMFHYWLHARDGTGSTVRTALGTRILIG